MKLTFSVGTNGLNTTISEVTFDKKETEIRTAKHLARAPVNTLTGTYDCTNCVEVGVGFPDGRKWNVMTMCLGDNAQTLCPTNSLW